MRLRKAGPSQQCPYFPLLTFTERQNFRPAPIETNKCIHVADDKWWKPPKMMDFVFYTVGNILRRGENVGFFCFSPVPTFFSKARPFGKV